jgi:putative peptidoglycan lipid II flippase
VDYNPGVASLTTEPPPATEAHGLARSASIIALGNVASRGLGFAREFVKAWLFGAGPQVDALNLALTIPVQIYDLVTGGLVNSALVPAFSDYTAEERRAELWRLASLLLSLAAVLIAALVAVLVFFAPQVIGVFAFIGSVVGEQTSPEAVATATSLVRVTLPAVIFLSLSGILTGLLYALKRFTLPALTSAVFNLSMVVVSLLLAAEWGEAAMALGLLVGAALQVLLQLPGLREGLRFLRPAFNLRHPGLRRILRAYVPILVSLVVTQISVYFGLSVAFGFVNGLSWMNYATNLYQFPLGLVGVAISSAILPTLARQAPATTGEYKATLVQGLNLVLVLIIPAAVGMFLLAEPIVALAFERGRFTAVDTASTALVLRWFLAGLSFAAVDLLLIAAFYARRDTLTPSSVGVLSVVVYVSVVVVAQPWLGLLSLMLADSLKQLTHALTTGALLSRRIGGFGGTGLWPTLGRIALAVAVMAAGVAATLALTDAIPFPARWIESLARVLLPGAVGALLYFFVASRLNLAEARTVLDLLQRRLKV